MSYLEVGGQRRAIPPGELSIGSDPTSQILLTGPGVAPRHVVVQGTPDGQVVVRKASPALEVLINGVRLGPQPTPLLHGDKIQVANFELLFVDERRSGSTQYVQAVTPASLAQAAKPGKKGPPTASTGGRVVSLTDGREYPVTGQSLVLGRDASCDVVLTDKSVSRRHAEIMATPKGYLLVDSSTNGTFVNGERVEGQRLLARADVIRCGGEEFRFYADAAREPAALPAPAPAAAVPAAAAAPRLANTMFGIPAAKPAQPPAAPVSPRTGEDQALNVRQAKTQAPSASPPPASQPPAAAPPPGPAPARPGPPGTLATLLVRSGPLKGQRFPIRVPIVNVGRAEYNDIVLADDSVSTVHAKLQRREGVWVVVDLDSTNGTFVDGERIQGEAPIAPGALLRFGAIGTMFEGTDDTVDPAKGSSTKLMSAFKMPPPPPSGPFSH